MSDPTVRPPAPERRPRRVEVHGVRLEDPYHWLRERDSPEVRRHLEAENAYTAALMRDTEPLQKTLYDELLARIRQTDLSVPVRLDGYFYYSRTEEGRAYAIHCRKKASLSAPEEVILDQNALAEGLAYLRLGALRVSPDHRLLAYSTDTDGSERYALVLKDLGTGRLLGDRIEGTAGNVEWASDGRSLLYTTLNASRRPDRLWRHTLGRPQGEDALLFHEPDEAFFLGIRKTKDRSTFVMEFHSQVTSEARLLDAADPGNASGFRTVEPRRHGVEYSVERHGDRLIVLTNDGAPTFRLAAAPFDRPSRANWKDLVGARDAVTLEGVEVFREYLVTFERQDGLVRIRVRGTDGTLGHEVGFPEAVYTAWRSANPEYDARALRFGYTSLVTPHSVYDYDLVSRERTLLKATEVLGGYDPSAYATERLFAVSHDGTRVPVSLVYRLPFERDGSRPLLLYGYGAYGISTDAEFSSNRLSLLDRGFVFAIAHVRGGEDLGRAWYEDGKLGKKPNTFLDLVACAEHLAREGYTSPARLALTGGSAGGLLVGAALNMRPELFAAAIAKVPFVDVVNTMLDESLPLTVIEYDEWGNPSRREDFERLLSYSPYDNVGPHRYPHVLVTGGLNDPRVQSWEPAKWAARLRERSRGGAVLLKMDMGSGHGGPTDRYAALKETAFDYAFLLKALGLAPPPVGFFPGSP